METDGPGPFTVPAQPEAVRRGGRKQSGGGCIEY